MSRLPAAAFAALVAATVAAFFVTQHLKVTTPLIQGAPAPVPAAFDPLAGVHGAGEPRSCQALHGGVATPIDYRRTYVTFYLQHQADHVAVYIVDTTGTIVRTIASSYDFRRIDRRNPPGAFAWNGREDDGRVAPDGTYYYRIVLIGQSRTVQLAKPITISTTPPRPVVARVTPSLISPVAAGALAAAPARTTIRYGGVGALGGQVTVLRTDPPGPPRQVFSFAIHRRHATTIAWNGLIRGRPAPVGTYLIGLRAIDDACHVGSFPAERPPVPGTTPHAGVTVRYLAAEVPNTPTPAGGAATVYVDSRRRPYRWALRRATGRAVLARGVSDRFVLRVPLPGRAAGLYRLALRSAGHRTVVPLVASAPAGATPRVVLVVLPALSWQGANPVDDDGDGLPNTLDSGGPIALARPLADGLPADYPDEAALLGELGRVGFRYDLTTDLALLADPGMLGRHRGVVLAGSERWLPGGLRTALRGFVAGGGHLLSVGPDALRRGVTISAGEARAPTGPAATDAFGAAPGAPVTGNGNLVIVFADPLRLFGTTSGAFAGLRSFQPIRPPAGVAASTAGISAGESAIAGFPFGHGTVIEVGLGDFGALTARSADFRALLARLWRVLG